jgi:hypothetical protein
VNGLTAKQVHERTLLIGATVALMFAGRLTWWETDTRVFNGWWMVASESRGFVTTGEAVLVGSGAALMVILAGATVCRPYVLTARGAAVIGLLAGLLTLGQIVLLAVGETSDTIDARFGLVVSTILSMVVTALWMRLAADPWPRSTVAGDSLQSDGSERPSV